MSLLHNESFPAHRAGLDSLIFSGSVFGKGVNWTNLDLAAGSVLRANVDGSGIETLVTGLNEPHGLVLDVAQQKMYWTESAAGRIQRSNFDGTSVEDVLTGLPSPTQIDLNSSEGKIYWTDGLGHISRANLDGSAAELLVSGSFAWGIAVVPEPSSIALATIGFIGFLAWRRRKHTP
jgi:hypothetical protein